MRAHIIENGRVVNTIEVASLDFMPGLIDADEHGGSIGDEWDGLAVTPPPLPPLDRTALAAQIDDAVAAVTSRYTRFQPEYEMREAQAAAFRDAAYTGAVPRQVAAFATPAGKTPQEATDIILAQAAQLRGALDSLGELRMRKYEVLRAATDDAARTALAEILAGVAAIDAALG